MLDILMISLKFRCTQNVNWMLVRLSDDAPDVFWTSYVCSSYVLCPEVNIFLVVLLFTLKAIIIVFNVFIENFEHPFACSKK